MNMYDIIVKKRDGGKLSRKEIDFFVAGYTAGVVPDYQASALLMAIFFSRMDKEETFHLTRAMMESGDVMDLSGIAGVKVDKHSTGGVGDKTTLIAAPIAAACGVPIAKMSGRGLGFTGGTVDKMESIPGFRTGLSSREFMDLVNQNGIAVVGQTAQIAKADKLLYALRDVTGTIENESLIASSVMSKKLASGSDAILLDVKCGRGAFMREEAGAVSLGKLMVEIGKAAGKATVAVITAMEQPLGKAIGNSLEVIEAIEVLKNQGPDDIRELSLVLAGIMISLSGGTPDAAGHREGTCVSSKDPGGISLEEGKKLAEEALESGAALQKMGEFIRGQGGEERVLQDASLFPQATHRLEIYSDETGYISQVAADRIGLASRTTGAGRAVKGEKIDLAAGILLNKKTGDPVEIGERLATLFGNDRERLQQAAREGKDAFKITSEKPKKEALIKETIGLSSPLSVLSHLPDGGTMI